MLDILGELLMSCVYFLFSLEQDFFVDVFAITWGRVVGCGGCSKDFAVNPLKADSLVLSPEIISKV